MSAAPVGRLGKKDGLGDLRKHPHNSNGHKFCAGYRVAAGYSRAYDACSRWRPGGADEFKNCEGSRQRPFFGITRAS